MIGRNTSAITKSRRRFELAQVTREKRCAVVTALLGMELHAVDGARRHRRRERNRTRRRGNRRRVSGRHGERMRVVGMEDPGNRLPGSRPRLVDADGRPSDVGHERRVKARDDALDESQPVDTGILLAPVEEELHAETDADQRVSGARPGPKRFPQAGLAKALHGRPVPSDAREDQRARARQPLRARDAAHPGAQPGERAFDVAEIAGAVVDDANHRQPSSRPFVLGTRARYRASRATASFKALPTVLKMASAAW